MNICRPIVYQKKKLFEFMDTKRLRGRSSKRPSLQVSKGEIELQNIEIRGVLKDLSATIPGGARLAVIGDNGAGKSTLLQVIARLVDPDRGKVLIDGQDIRKCNMSSVRKAIGIVSPDLPLLKGSVGYNLRYRKPDAAAEELARVRQLCKIDDLSPCCQVAKIFASMKAAKTLPWPTPQTGLGPRPAWPAFHPDCR